MQSQLKLSADSCTRGFCSILLSDCGRASCHTGGGIRIALRAACQRADQAITNRLNPYTNASPSIFSASAKRAAECPCRPARPSMTNINALIASTIYKPLPWPWRSATIPQPLSSQQLFKANFRSADLGAGHGSVQSDGYENSL